MNYFFRDKIHLKKYLKIKKLFGHKLITSNKAQVELLLFERKN